MEVRFTNPAQQRDSSLKKRLKIFYFGLCIGYLVVMGRAVDLALQDNQKLEAIAVKQYRAAIHKATDRGRILDNKGQELAISIPTWSLYADPREIQEPIKTATLLSSVLNVSKDSLVTKFREGRKFVWIKRRLDGKAMEKIRDLKVKGIYSLKENMRFYPHGTLGGVILGAVGIDSQPLAGVELAYDSYLMIPQNPYVYLKDARGHLYLPPTSFETSTQQGDVILTIDKNIQFFAEEALSQAVQTHQAKAGILILMDSRSGAILAMANFPPFNPNHYEKTHLDAWRNRAITDTFEPGSTFKVIMAAAALENRLLSLHEKIDCEQGSLQLENGHSIHDHHPYSLLNLGEIIKVSSNIGAYKIGQRLGKENFFRTIRAFGFGEKTGIDFPGEVSGIVRPSKQWRPIELGTIAFGQGIGVTPLQMLSAFSAIANSGQRMRPFLVQKVLSPGGEILYQANPTLLGQPISPETAATLTQLLKGVVEEGGSGTQAAMEDYPVAGKTGTAQKGDLKNGGYLEDKYVASFVGFAPADDPRLVALVMMDEPQGSYYGGVVAAPVFKDIMRKSLHYLGVVPQGKEKSILWADKQKSATPSVPFTTTMTQEGSYFKIPDFRGTTLRQVLKATSFFPITLELKGRGEAILQRPEAGTLVSAGSTIYVEFQPLY